MKKIIIFLILITGITPVITEQGFTLSSYQMFSQDEGFDDEAPVNCIPTPVTTTVTTGDWTTTTTCSLVLDASINDCVEDCYEQSSYDPQPDPNDGDDCYPYPCDEPEDPYPGGTGGGDTGGGTGGGTGDTGGSTGGTGGGGTGGSTGGTTTTNPDFPLKSISIPIATTSVKLDEKRAVVNGVTVITMAPIVKQIPQIPTADLGKIVISYNLANGKNLATSTVQTQVNAFNQGQTPLSTEVMNFLIDLQLQVIANYPTNTNEVVQFEAKPWYLDNDNDGYHASATIAVNKPTNGNWKTSTSGNDCDDTKSSITTKVLFKELVNSSTTKIGDVVFSSGINSKNLGLGSDEQSSFGGANGISPKAIPIEFNERFFTLRYVEKNKLSARRKPNARLITVNLTSLSDSKLLSFLESPLRLGAVGSTMNSSVDVIMNGFTSKQGGMVENVLLGSAIDLNDGTSGHQISDLLNSIKNNLCKLASKLVCPPIDTSILEPELENISLPSFSTTNPTLYSQLGGTQGIEVTKGQNGNMQVALFDTFGVDIGDVVRDRGEIKNFIFTATQGIRGMASQWILQHQRGYKPIILKVPLDMTNFSQINFNNCN